MKVKYSILWTFALNLILFNAYCFLWKSGDEMRMRIANCELLIANCELLIANCALRMPLLLVISLLVSIQWTSIQRMSNLAKPSPHLTRLPTRLALALAIPTPTPPLPFPPLTTPLFPTCTTYYQLCNPGGGGGGTRDIYWWGCALAHQQLVRAQPIKWCLRCGHSPPKRGVLGTGRYNQNNGGLSCVYNPKKGHL